MSQLKKYILNKNTFWLIVISIFMLLYATLSITLFTQAYFQEYLLSFSPTHIQSFIYLVLILTVLSSIGMPRQVTAFTCGYFFEFSLGALLATMIVTMAAFITYKVAYLFQHSFIVKKHQKKLNKLHHFLSVNTFSKALIIRLLPVGSNFLTNMLAGLSNIPLVPYLGGSCLGFIPQMVIFSLVGSGIKLASSVHIYSAILLFIIAILLGYKLYRQHKVDLT